MRLRVGVIAMALVFIFAACGGGKKVTDSGGGTTTPNSATGVTKPAACTNGTALTSSEIGVTPTTITVTVMADSQNAVKPGLFQGSIEAVKAWANYINANGGLACRQVVVKATDSKLTQDDARNGVSTACTDSLALVGTTSLFLQDVSGMNGCKDKAGAPTGLPDIAELQTEPAQQCSPVSFATLPNSSSCPYTSGKRTFKVGYTQYDYYFKKYGANALHGVFVIPKDLASTIAASMPIFRAENQMGIKSDKEFGRSGLDGQPQYTEIATAMKTANSTYARNGLDYSGTVLMRKEAQAQGVTSVKVWDCSVQCYDKRTITTANGATEGQYVWLNILPMEDGASANPELAKFLQYDKKPDGFGEQAWVAGEIFARAVNDTMAANAGDPNSITRANLLKAIRGIHDFDAGGLVPKVDIGNKVGSPCLVGMQVQGTKFVRVDPVQPGTFDCDNNKPPLTLTIDPAAAYHG
jgi:hypothetical protein